MTSLSTPPPDRGGSRPRDHRLVLVAEWLDACDRLDGKARHEAVVKLRGVGISVCAIQPVAVKGGRK